MSEQSSESGSTPEGENRGLNQLNELGNRAIELGLISGHGHHQGQYDIICQGEVVTLPPKQAVSYFQALIRSAGTSASTAE